MVGFNTYIFFFGFNLCLSVSRSFLFIDVCMHLYEAQSCTHTLHSGGESDMYTTMLREDRMWQMLYTAQDGREASS